MTRLYLLLGFVASTLFCSAQITTCNANSVPPIVAGEGIADRVGDIVLNCSGGAANATITGNFSVFLNVNITNRLVAGAVTDIIFTIDRGAGPVPVSVPGTITSPSQLVYNGLSFQLSNAGTAVLRIANVRAAAIQLMLQQNAPIQAQLSFTAGNLVSLSTTSLRVGYVNRALYAGSTTKLVCAPGGSPVPASSSFLDFLRSGASYSSTRFTEGFADAFGPKSAFANLNADSGQRIILQYSGFPAGAVLFVPDVIAGSDAVQPTGAGDFGVPASGGQYTPGANSSLLLARVPFADANGAGGAPVYRPGAVGSGTVTFDNVSAVALTNGAGVAVYEVVDANPNVVESAQVPTFLGLAPAAVNTPTYTSESTNLAPISTVVTATATAPIPRYAVVTPPNDCTVVGDCSANYFPRLYVDTTPISFTAQAGSGYQVAYTVVQNQGGGTLNYSVTVNYLNGSGFLTVDPASGTNRGGIRIDATPGTLAPGTYQANIVVDAGPVAGQQTIRVTLMITAAPPPPVPLPAVTSAVNAASLTTGPLTPGSLATLMGLRLLGTAISVTFDGLPATILYNSATQINLLVPPGLGLKTSAQLVVTVNGVSAPAQTVALASVSPAIFPGAVLNQNYSVNSAGNPALTGSIIQVFATGLSGGGMITAQIHDRIIDVPYYGGPAPGLTGVQQVDILIPQDLPSMTTDVYVCGFLGTQKTCSAAARVTLQQPNP